MRLFGLETGTSRLRDARRAKFLCFLILPFLLLERTVRREFCVNRGARGLLNSLFGLEGAGIRDESSKGGRKEMAKLLLAFLSFIHYVDVV